MEDNMNSADDRGAGRQGRVRRFGTLAVVLGVALAVALVTVGLTAAFRSGGSSDKNKSASTGSAESGKKQSNRDKNMAFVECLRENGFPEVPAPESDGGIMIDASSGIDVDGKAFKKAEEECQRKTSPVGDKRKTPPDAQVPDTTEYVACMRKNGQPKFPKANAQGMFTGIDPNSAEFKAAQKACAKHMPMPAASPKS